MTEFPPPCWTEYQRHREEIESAVDQRKWPIAWLDCEVLNGRATVMADAKACIVIALRSYPGGLVEIHGLVAAGEKGSIIRLIGQAERWGKEHGAHIGSISSRRGWVRALPDYRETQVTIEKEL